MFSTTQLQKFPSPHLQTYPWYLECNFGVTPLEEEALFQTLKDCMVTDAEFDEFAGLDAEAKEKAIKKQEASDKKVDKLEEAKKKSKENKMQAEEKKKKREVEKEQEKENKKHKLLKDDTPVAELAIATPISYFFGLSQKEIGSLFLGNRIRLDNGLK